MTLLSAFLEAREKEQTEIFASKKAREAAYPLLNSFYKELVEVKESDKLNWSEKENILNSDSVVEKIKKLIEPFNVWWVHEEYDDTPHIQVLACMKALDKAMQTIESEYGFVRER